MALPPNYRQIATPPSISHMPTLGSYVNVGMLKDRLRAQISGGNVSNSSQNLTGNPFITSSHGHPSFTPVRMGNKTNASDARTPKPPKVPDKPVMPYMRYSRKNDYDKAMKTFQSPSGYQTWVAAKGRANQYAEDRDVLDRAPSIIHSNSYLNMFLQQKTDGRIAITAEDEEDSDDGYSVKHIAAARYLRNHRLINEIFSDVVVPDVRSVVTVSRMAVLKRQVQSLTMHQKKLVAELQQIEDRFDVKKRKFIDSSDAFQEELKKHCVKAVDPEMYKKMVDRAFEQLQKERAQAQAAEEAKQQQQLLQQQQFQKQRQEAEKAQSVAHNSVADENRETVNKTINPEQTEEIPAFESPEADSAPIQCESQEEPMEEESTDDKEIPDQQVPSVEKSEEASPLPQLTETPANGLHQIEESKPFTESTEESPMEQPTSSLSPKPEPDVINSSNDEPNK